MSEYFEKPFAVIIDHSGMTIGRCVLKKSSFSMPDYWTFEAEIDKAFGWERSDEPVDWKFHSGIYAKWDSCSHWYFYGEDSGVVENFIAEENEVDSYYRLCGPGNVVKHIELIAFGELCAHEFYEQACKKNGQLMDYANGPILYLLKLVEDCQIIFTDLDEFRKKG